MAISDNYAPDKSSGNGVTTLFTGSWNPIASSYFRLYWEDKTTGEQTLKTLGTHYTLAFTTSGYTVTADPSYVPPSTVWVIRSRVIAKDQTDPYRTSIGFQGAVTENSFDKITAITQDLGENLERALVLPLGTSTVLVPMEAPDAGKGLRWNDTEDGIINSEDDIDDIVSDATAQADIATAQAVIATAQAGLAATARAAADADVILTHADVTTTNNNVTTTNNNVTTTNNNVTTTNNNVTTTNNNVTTTNTNAATATTQAATATTQAALAATAKTAADADVVLTHADAISTAANVVSSAANVTLAAQAAGFTYKFSTNTASSDPTSGYLKFDNGTLASATALYISETTNDAQAIAAYLATLDDSTSTIKTSMRLYKQGAASNFVIFNITGTLTDNGTWDTFTVAYVTGSGSFSNNDLLTAQFIAVGDKGTTGATGATGTMAYTVATGSANAQVLTPTSALGAYVAGDARWMVPVASNTAGAVTVAVSGLAARNIKKFIGGAVVVLAVGDLIINQPALLVDDGTQYILVNPKDYTQGADVASSGTTNLDTTTGDYVHITGTTNITAITLSQGRRCEVVFDGILTLTNGASLILEGGANITTAAGDTAVFRGEAAGVVRCIKFQKKTGKGTIAPADADLTFTDVVTNNASTSNHGFMAKLSNSATLYYDSLGTQTNPALNAVLTGYSSGAGTVASTDTILQAIQKLNGNIAALAAAGLTTIASGTLSTGAPTLVDLTSIPATYRALVLYVSGASNTVATRALIVRPNAGGGLGTDLTVGSQINTATAGSINTASALWAAVTQTAAQTAGCVINFPAYQSGPIKSFNGVVEVAATAGADWGTAQFITTSGVIATSASIAQTGALTGLRITWDNVATGVFDGTGTYALYGVN